MPRDIEDLIGLDPAEETLRQTMNRNKKMDVTETFNGVTVTWLMQAFRMDRISVKKKLAELQPIRYEGGEKPVYDFVQAAAYLVKPKFNVDDYIKKLRPQDLPNDLRKEYWDAKLKQQRWEERAGKLWRTDDILEVFGEAFKHIKTSMQLWVNQLDRSTGLTDEQRKRLIQMTDQLQSEMHQKLTSMKDFGATRSSKVFDEDGDDSDD